MPAFVRMFAVTWMMVAFFAPITHPPASADTVALVLRSGSVPDQDEHVWVRGSTEVRPGVREVALPAQHPFIVPTPAYWGNLGGGAFWLCPTPDGFAPPGGYEYFSEFTLPDDFVGAVLNVVWRGDDYVKLAVNDTRLLGTGQAPPEGTPAILHQDITALVRRGSNRLRFLVENALTTRNPTGVTYLATVTYVRLSAGTLQAGFISLKSGGVDRDDQVWVRGMLDINPGWPSSGLPAQHPFVVTTPGYWGDLGGSGYWLSPLADATGPDGGYEYYLDFVLPDAARGVTLDLRWRGNDFAIPAVNGSRLTGLGEFRPNRSASTLRANISAAVHPGTNRLSFLVWNAPFGFSPTGVAFYATITYVR